MRRVVLGMAMLAIGMVVGCSRPDPLGFTPVTGRVTFDGEPLERGEIRFQPDMTHGNRGPASASPLGKGGHFSLRGPGARVGAIPGSHRVYLAGTDTPTAAEPMLLIDGTFVRPDGPITPSSRVRVPQSFLAPETSGMVATVTPGKPNEITFDLSSPTPAERAGSK